MFSQFIVEFFCGLYSLVYFVEVCNIFLVEVEKGFFEDSFLIFDKLFL